MPQWFDRKTHYPSQAGWYYVRQSSRAARIGIRYFDDSDRSWWHPSKDGLHPNDTFEAFLFYPGITDRQGTAGQLNTEPSTYASRK